MGQVIQKPVAEALVNLVGSVEQDPAIRAAAADALADLSGQAGIGPNPQQWIQWLNARASRPPAEWRTQVLAEQHSRLERDADRLRQLKASVETMMLDQYQRDPKVLPGYLNNSDPQIRAIGASLVPRAIALGQPVGPDIHRRLIDLVGDGSAEVRFAAVQALRGLADPDALDAMLAQLQMERDPEVKVALCAAIGNIGDGRAVPILTRLLNDPSPRVAAQAATALRNLAPAIRQNPAQARRVLDLLTQAFSARTGSPGQANNEPGSEDLRVALLSAMSPIADLGANSAMFNLFADLANANRNESPPVRRAALEALGTIGIRAGNEIVQELDPAVEPDPTVRIAAISALGQAGSFDYATEIDKRALPQFEPNADVRRHAQRVFQGLLPKATPQQLSDWAQNFKRRNDPVDQIAVLKTLCEKQGPSPDLAINQQNLGELYLNAVNQPANAVPSIRSALQFWQARRAQQQIVYSLVQQMISALVRSKQYPETIQFAQQQIQGDRAWQLPIGMQLRNEVKKLIDAGKRGGQGSADDYRDAVRLINMVLAMNPPVGEQYQDELRSMLEQQIPASSGSP